MAALLALRAWGGGKYARTDKRGSLSNFRFLIDSFHDLSMSKLGMASLGFRGHGGHGGRPQYAHDLGNPLGSLLAKFHGHEFKIGENGLSGRRPQLTSEVSFEVIRSP